VRGPEDRSEAWIHGRTEGRRHGDPLRDKFTDEELPEERQRLVERIMASPSYKIAFEDEAFLHEDQTRPARLQLELMKPERTLLGHHIKSTIVVFGSARVQSHTVTKKELAELEKRAKTEPDSEGLPEALHKAKKRAYYSRYYEEARKLSRMISERFQQDHRRHYVIITGGG